MARHATVRATVPLDGTWAFHTGSETAVSPADVDWTAARTVTVPHVWQEHDDLRDYTGSAWYRRTVDLDAGAVDRRVFLRFGAADYETTAWVDGERVGTHQGGYLPFEFEITDVVTPGETVIAVEVRDPDDVSEIPHGKQGSPWYTRVSGIWQSVTIEVRPATYVRGAFVTPDLDTDTATVDIDVDAPDADALTATVTARRDGEPAASATVDPRVDAAVLSFDDPDYWSPDSPSLYDLEVTLAADGHRVDRYTDTFGMRSIEATADGLRLNGAPLPVRGLVDQEFYPETLYRPHEPGLFEREIETITDLGFNLVRKHQKPAHPDFVDLADEHGLLIWEEPASPAVHSARARDAVRDQLAALVRRDYNAPSVIAYTLSALLSDVGPAHDHRDPGSGSYPTWAGEDATADLRALYEFVRERDPTRLLCDNSGSGHVVTDINDYHKYFALPDRAEEWAAELDHLSIHRTDNYVADADADETAPILLSEFGAWGLCDVTRLLEWYDGEPTWFQHDTFDTPASQFTQPADFDARFERSPVSDVFTDVDDLAEAWQRRQFTSVKGVMERVRVHDDVAGYVLTQLSDVEWEFNGVLTALREEKAFTNDLAAINGPVAVCVDPHERVAWGDDRVPVDVTLVNDRADAWHATLDWRAADGTGRLEAVVDAGETVTLESAFTVEPPHGDPAGRVQVAVETPSGEVASTETVTFVDRATAVADESVVVYLRGASPGGLTDDGVTIQHELDDAVDVAVTTELTPELEAYAEAGGSVLFIPPAGGSTASAGPFEFRQLPRNNSWSSTASLFYHDSPLLDGLAAGRRLGWSFDGHYPYAVVTDLHDDDQVHVGYLKGWFADDGSPLVTRPHGDGVITACTLRILDAPEDDPLATVLLRRLVDFHHE